MPRKLSAIEIAEGALLADIAVVFQLLVKYLPIGGAFFALLVPPLFTILVLRQRLYAAIMGLCVALFIVGILTGINSVQIMLLEVGAGVFLGVMMKYRLHYIPLIALGTIGSAILFFGHTMLSILLLGKTFIDSLLHSLRVAYTGAFSALDFITPQIGLGSWWHQLAPAAKHLADLSLQYWLVLLFISDLIFACPLVIFVYYITTFLVRLLGYDVRPFPDGWLNRLIKWFIRLLIKLALAVGLGKFWPVQLLIKEMRRQNIGLGRQKVNP